jgi:hypothetical protein
MKQHMGGVYRPYVAGEEAPGLGRSTIPLEEAMIRPARRRNRLTGR